MKGAWIGKLALVLATATLSAQQPFSVQLPERPVVFGQPFELRVTGSEEFDDARLMPLVVERLGRRTVGGRTEWTYRARCYELGDLQLASEPAVTLRVASSLPEPPGELEWPSDGWQLAERTEQSWWIAAVAAVALLFGIGWWRSTRSRGAAPVVVQPDGPDALADLRALALPVVDGDVIAFYAELKSILRRHCGQRFAMPADVRTSEELVALVAGGEHDLAPCLATCDLVLFARALPASDGHEASRDRAIAFVQNAEVAS